MICHFIMKNLIKIIYFFIVLFKIISMIHSKMLALNNIVIRLYDDETGGRHI
jgi:hypothetical protein